MTTDDSPQALMDSSDAAAGVFDYATKLVQEQVAAANITGKAILMVHIDLGTPESVTLLMDQGDGYDNFAEWAGLDADLELLVPTVLARGLSPLSPEVRQHVGELVASGDAHYALAVMVGQMPEVMYGLLVSSDDRAKPLVLFRVGEMMAPSTETVN
jgi:hypothetical protein